MNKLCAWGRWLLILALLPSVITVAEYRKPGADTELLESRSYHLELGETRVLELDFSAPKAGQDLQVLLLKHSGVTVLTPETSWHFQEGAARVELQVMANEPGTHRLQFLASTWPQNNPQQRLNRALGVTVSVAGEANIAEDKLQTREAASSAKARADGRRTVEFLAEETVR